MLEQQIQELKQIIAANDGRNAADARFSRLVDELVSAVYDDIGMIKELPTRALFDLFVIKVLYVGRHSCHADVIDYLGRLLDTYIAARELFPPDASGKPQALYFSDMLDAEKLGVSFETRFEAYRTYADGALFRTGIFPASLGASRTHNTPLRGHATRAVDAAYYVTTGKTMYRMAARDEHASCAHGPDTLDKLADHFEVYVGALNEMSSRYILGFDTKIVADHMLDSYNAFNASGDRKHAANMSRYAEMLALDPNRLARHEPH